MKIESAEIQINDPRKNVRITRGDIVLQVSGYDMLPHLMKDEKNYERITWEQFRLLLTKPD